MADLRKFEMIGTRLSSCKFNEEAMFSHIRDHGRGGNLDLQIALNVKAGDISVMPESFGDRDVIEAAFTFVVKCRHGEGDDLVDFGNVCEMQFTAGFIGRSREDDANEVAFREDGDLAQRAAFWAVRSHIQQMLSITLMRGVNVPWDIREPKRSRPKAQKPKSTGKKKTAATKAS